MMTGKRIRARFGGKAALAVAGVFLAGLFAGLAVARWSSPAADPAPIAAGITTSLDALDLTPEQSQQIERILAGSQARTDRALEEVLPRLRAVVDSVDGEIRAVLTEDQRVRFEELRRHRVVRRRVMRGDSIVAETADTFAF